MLIVPANVPHQVIPTGGAPIVLMTLHVAYPPQNWLAGQLVGLTQKYARSGPTGA